MKKVILLSLGFNGICLSAFSQDSVWLQEVVIREPGRIYNVKRAGNESIDKLLSQQNQISLIKRGAFAQEPMINGYAAGQINLTIDGMQIFGACTDRMDPISSYISPNNLEKISVEESTNMMASHIGGSMNFKLQMPDFIDTHTSWNGMIGVIGQTNGLGGQLVGNLKYQSPRWAFNLSGNTQKASNYTSGGPQHSTIQFSQYQKWNANLGLAYSLGDDSKIVLQYIQDEGKDIGYPGLMMDVAFAKAKIGSISYILDNRRLKWDTKLYMNYIDHAMDDTKRPPEMVFMHMDMPGWSKTMGGYSTLSLLSKNKWYHQFTLSGYNNRMSSEMTMYPDIGLTMYMLTIPDATRNMLGVGYSTEYSKSHCTQFLLTGRLEYQNSDLFSNAGYKTWSSMGTNDLLKHKLLPSFSATWKHMWKMHQLMKLSVDFSTRNASLQELYGFYTFNQLDNYDYIGNPNLKTEKKLGIQLHHKAHWNKVSLEGKVFYHYLMDYIVGNVDSQFSVMTNGAKGVKIQEGLDYATKFGAGIKLDWRISKLFNYRFKADYLLAKDNRSAYLPFQAPLTMSQSLHAKVLKDYSFEINHRFATAQHKVSTTIYGELPSEAFSVLDLSLYRKWKFKREHHSLEAKLTCENILNTKYYEHLDLMKIYRPGRNFGIQCYFNF